MSFSYTITVNFREPMSLQHESTGVWAKMKTLKVSESIGPNLWCWESSCSFDFHLDGGIRNIWLEWPIP